MTTLVRQVRQGDVLLQPIHRLPSSMTPVPSTDGRVVLAYGEVTGHAHTVSAQHATLYEDDAGNRCLHVTDATPFVHEEHGAIDLIQETYRVIQQRQYSPSAIRPVAD